jgi:serine/threonine protein phosphatase PrpC
MQPCCTISAWLHEVARRDSTDQAAFPASMNLQSYGVTDVGLKRTHNEDSFLRSDDLGLYVVADGMGGHAAGEVASTTAIQSVEDFAAKQAHDQSLTWPFGFDTRFSVAANALLNGLRLANHQLCRMQQEQPDLSGMGTTVAALRIDGTEATIAHVGDSRVYRLRQGEFGTLTSDHSWVNEQLQKHIITEEEARNHRYKNVITRALGNRPELEIDVRVEQVESGDLYLVCSDGLSGMVGDEAILDTLNSMDDLRECANKLVMLANEAGGNDNITVVLVKCEA